ncbi:hypothetical protein [Alicyclobacillus shizuokensis]|uniref:hypothetical protein n=1 Tax=Alicyclobacillus shizuokensis TaxID=392014 RepID=UPI0008333FE3|nr:hypothetical protein [Alicyclobacillus shizuokensis]
MRSKLNITVLVMLVLLFIQYVVGMVTNLFVQIPDSLSSQYKSGGAFYRYWWLSLQWILAHSSIFLRLHVIVGILLVIGSVLVAGMSIVMKSRVWIIFSILGSIFTIGAGVNGMFFVSFGQHDINSLIMAIAFLAAFVCYASGYYVGQSRFPHRNS